MRGYPKHIATVADCNNLLASPEFKRQALEDLGRLQKADDDNVQKTLIIADDGKAETEEIKNPKPIWKQKGFKNRKAVTDLIRQYGGEV
jgi:hypothetical protein